MASAEGGRGAVHGGPRLLSSQTGPAPAPAPDGGPTGPSPTGRPGTMPSAVKGGNTNCYDKGKKVGANCTTNVGKPWKAKYEPPYL